MCHGPNHRGTTGSRGRGLNPKFGCTETWVIFKINRHLPLITPVLRGTVPAPNTSEIDDGPVYAIHYQVRLLYRIKSFVKGTATAPLVVDQRHRECGGWVPRVARPPGTAPPPTHTVRSVGTVVLFPLVRGPAIILETGDYHTSGIKTVWGKYHIFPRRYNC